MHTLTITAGRITRTLLLSDSGRLDAFMLEAGPTLDQIAKLYGQLPEASDSERVFGEIEAAEKTLSEIASLFGFTCTGHAIGYANARSAGAHGEAVAA